MAATRIETPESVKVLSIMLATGLTEREARQVLAERSNDTTQENR